MAVWYHSATTPPNLESEHHNKWNKNITAGVLTLSSVIPKFSWCNNMSQHENWDKGQWSCSNLWHINTSSRTEARSACYNLWPLTRLYLIINGCLLVVSPHLYLLSMPILTQLQTLLVENLSSSWVLVYDLWYWARMRTEAVLYFCWVNTHQIQTSACLFP